MPNGRCTLANLAVAGAKVNEIALISPVAALQNGIVLHGMRVGVANQVVMDACNFTGTTMTPISSLPIRVITYG